MHNCHNKETGKNIGGNHFRTLDNAIILEKNETNKVSLLPGCPYFLSADKFQPTMQEACPKQIQATSQSGGQTETGIRKAATNLRGRVLERRELHRESWSSAEDAPWVLG